MAVDTSYTWGTGRRKSAVARVRIKPGNGTIRVNDKELTEYFNRPLDVQHIMAPLETTETGGSYDIWCNVRGGGTAGQAGAVQLGLSRALAIVQPELESVLRDNQYLTRDDRVKERKKCGQKGARASFQFSKR